MLLLQAIYEVPQKKETKKDRCKSSLGWESNLGPSEYAYHPTINSTSTFRFKMLTFKWGDFNAEETVAEKQAKLDKFLLVFFHSFKSIKVNNEQQTWKIFTKSCKIHKSGTSPNSAKFLCSFSFQIDLFGPFILTIVKF